MADKISIHRALSELKVIGDRIERAILDLRPTGWQVNNKLVNNQWEKKVFDETAQAQFQSTTDLIKRREALKAAIVKSNATKVVVIGGKEMTVAAAISKKESIAHQKALLAKLSANYAETVRAVEANNQKVTAAALELAGKALSKQNVKIGDDDVQKIVKPYLDAHSAVTVDALGIEKIMKELGDEIRNFETDVDATLSESNALTIIEV